MANEFMDIVEVKNEFLRNVGPEYARSYPPQQLDLALYLLNDFCNNLVSNGLILFRQTPEPRIPPQQYYQPQPPQQFRPEPVARPMGPPPRYAPQEFNPNPFDEEAQFRQQQQAQYEEQRMRNEEYEVQRNIAEMNAQLQQSQQRMPPRMVPRQEYVPQQQEYIPPQSKAPVQDVSLAAEKPKTFVDKIKEMRTPKKSDKINPEE